MPDGPIPARKSRPTTITLSAEQHADLRELAARRFSSVSQIVRQIVRDALPREKRDEVHPGGR